MVKDSDEICSLRQRVKRFKKFLKGDVVTPDPAGEPRLGIMVDDTWDELCSDQELVACPHLHRVFFSFRDFE